MTATITEIFDKLIADPDAPVEPLHPDLQRYVREDDEVGMTIKHPLYYSIMHCDRLNPIANAQYEAKCKYASELKAQGNWRRLVWLYERPYRLWAFAQMQDSLSDHHYWQTLGDLWEDTENQHECLNEWRELLGSDRPRRWAFMDKRERDVLRSLRRMPVLVYRGFTYDGGETGLSWTRKRSMAEWFARRLYVDDGEQSARVAVGAVDHKDIFAYKNGRGEDEIVSWGVHITKIASVTP